MTLEKGSVVKQIRRNGNPIFTNTTANGELTYQVIRVNPKSYSLKCIDGYMKGSGMYLLKSFDEKHTDEYGTVTYWQKIR